MILNFTRPVQITIQECNDDSTPTCDVVLEPDAGTTDGEHTGNEGIPDLGLDLAFIDPNLTASCQTRLRVGIELRLYDGESKEEAKEALRLILACVSDIARLDRRLLGGLGAVVGCR